MPSIRSLASKHYAYTIASIISLSGLMPSYSYYTEKGLVYIIIANLSAYQLSSCSKCIKLNIRLSCDVHLMSNAEYIFYTCLTSL